MVIDLDIFEVFVIVDKVCLEFVLKIIGCVCCCYVGIENVNMVSG